MRLSHVGEHFTRQVERKLKYREQVYRVSKLTRALAPVLKTRSDVRGFKTTAFSPQQIQFYVLTRFISINCN